MAYSKLEMQMPNAVSIFWMCGIYIKYHKNRSWRANGAMHSKMSTKSDTTSHQWKEVQRGSYEGSCLKTGQHFVFAIKYYVTSDIWCITLYIYYCLYNIHILIPYQRYCLKKFMFKSQRFYLIMILIMENLLHNVYKHYLLDYRPIANLFLLLCLVFSVVLSFFCCV